MVISCLGEGRKVGAWHSWRSGQHVWLWGKWLGSQLSICWKGIQEAGAGGEGFGEQGAMTQYTPHSVSAQEGLSVGLVARSPRWPELNPIPSLGLFPYVTRRTLGSSTWDI